MKKLLSIVVGSFAIVNLSIAQNPIDSAYLLRVPDKQKSYVRIPNTGAYFITGTGLKEDHFGWQLPRDFVKSDGNMLYFEMNTTDVPQGPWSDYTGGSLELVINIPIGITSLNLDTINKLRYHLINNYAERGSSKVANNEISGLLSFEFADSTVTIAGSIGITTTKPFVTKQQVTFRDVKFDVFTKARFLYEESKKVQIKQQQERAAENIYNAIEDDKRNFFDSIFAKEMIKRNTLICVIDNKRKFGYLLNQSYILTHASLQRRPEGSLMDMLGSNFLAVDAGSKDVYLLHCFYDPAKNVSDDEINFSIGIQLDSTNKCKTYHFHKNELSATVILGYLHYGPYGRPILSKSAEGTLTVTRRADGLVSGTMNLTFYFDKSTFRIYGDYYLPKIRFEDVKSFRERLAQKYGNKVVQ